MDTKLPNPVFVALLSSRISEDSGTIEVCCIGRKWFGEFKLCVGDSSS